jgi:hypothetical protein
MIYTTCCYRKTENLAFLNVDTQCPLVLLVIISWWAVDLFAVEDTG